MIHSPAGKQEDGGQEKKSKAQFDFLINLRSRYVSTFHDNLY
jgi:hypothetical protein